MSTLDLAFGAVLATGAAIITALIIIAHAEVRARFRDDDEIAP